MPYDHSADLMKAFMRKLYKTLTGDDPNIKIPRSKFVSWLMPGIPISKKDFKYCEVGTVGFPTTETGPNGETIEVDASTMTRRLEHQAFNLSKLFDYVPELPEVSSDLSEFRDTGKLYQTVFMTTQDSISSIYKDVLNYSKVVFKELSDAEKDRIKRLMSAFVIEKESVDPLTGEKKTEVLPSPFRDQYEEKMKAYIDSATKFKQVQLEAQGAGGNSPESIERIKKWSSLGPFLLEELKNAEYRWNTEGHRRDYQEAASYADQVTRKSMVLYKDELIRKFELSKQYDTTIGNAEYYYATLIPGTFAESDSGWLEMGYSSSDYESNFDSAASSWSSVESAGLFGIFSVGSSQGESHIEASGATKTTKFSATLKYAQVPICRPWFEPGFFSMRGWILDDLWYTNYENLKVSDGKPRPVGRLIAYPTSALFVKDVSFRFAEIDSQYEFVSNAVNAGGYAGWGPFYLGGEYSSSSNFGSDSTVNREGGYLRIPGIQLIGYINNFVPNSPNPDPSLKPSDFVGGL